MKAKLRALEHRAVSGVWLLGEDFEEFTISEDTYRWLWSNINSICDRPRLVKMFWANSFQYFDYRLDEVYEIWNEDGNVINESEISKRRKERNRFLEFHYALGGLLLYRKQYNTISYIFNYTQSQPPRYVLLPETMTQVFFWFNHFSDEFNHEFPIDYKYYFPELDNLGNRRAVNYWICSYIAILFIRQYSLHPYLVTQNFTALPQLPKSLIALSNLLDNVSYFESCLKSILSNHALIEELNFDEIVKSKSDEFDKFIIDLKNKIRQEIASQKLNANLSVEKIEQFYIKSNDIISAAFKEYNTVFVPYDGSKSYLEGLKLNVIGSRTLMPKSAFADNDIPHMNSDSIFAELIERNKIRQELPNSFFAARTKRYLLNRENIITGLNKTINNKDDIFVIGININYPLRKLLEESKIKNQVFIPSTAHHTDNTFFVLGKGDLPAIEFKMVKEESINAFQLQRLNEEINLFASIIDLSRPENKEIKDQWIIEIGKDGEEPKVQVSILFDAIIYWKKDREVIQISVASEYEEQGIQNNIDDVKPITPKMEKK